MKTQKELDFYYVIQALTFNSNFGPYICNTSARDDCDENIRPEIMFEIRKYRKLGNGEPTLLVHCLY